MKITKILGVCAVGIVLGGIAGQLAYGLLAGAFPVEAYQAQVIEVGNTYTHDDYKTVTNATVQLEAVDGDPIEEVTVPQSNVSVGDWVDVWFDRDDWAILSATKPAVVTATDLTLLGGLVGLLLVTVGMTSAAAWGANARNARERVNA